MTTTLTDRYVHAATRWLPGRTRAEVEPELRERIADTIAARGGTASAERESLEELGDPLRVAVDYAGREPALISARFFFVWLRVTTWLVLSVPAIVAVIVVLVSVFEGDSLGSIIGEGVWTLIEMVVHVIFWTTLVFAVLDWTNSPNEAQPWTVDQLPSPPTAGIGDLIAALVFLPLAAAAIVWQHVRSPFFEDGDPIPMADPSLWAWYLPLVLVTLALELLHAFWIFKAGWTWPAAIANAALTLLFAVPTILVLTGEGMVNPDLIAHLGWDQHVVDDTMFWIAAGVALVSLWEIFDGFRKARLRS